MLLFPGLAPSVQWKGKIKLLNRLLCLFPSPLAIPAAETWPCLLFALRFFLSPCSNTQSQSFDHVSGSCCSSANPLLSSALLPSHHLSFFNIAALASCSLWSWGVPRSLPLFWLLQALLCGIAPIPPFFLFQRNSHDCANFLTGKHLFQAILLPSYAES